MCGIAGILSLAQTDQDQLEAMTDLMEHRGPNARGFKRLPGIGLGHRRLSIIDLSDQANQPLENENANIWMVCNGEIYNFRSLVKELETRGHRFKSGSDNEVLLHLYEEFGLDFLDKVNGMFAVAIWDSKQKRLVMAVDRFGKKPLYYAISGEKLVFASELKSLLRFKWIDRTIDPVAIDRYLSLRYVPAPLTIFKGIRKLEPATLMVWEKGKKRLHKYWKPPVLELQKYTPQVREDFRNLMTNAVELRMQSDVPLGLYLSGGIDSAVIGGVMHQLKTETLVSYTLGFDYDYDERPRALKIADFLGMESNSISVTESDFDLWPELVYHMDEPMGDLISLPSFLLAKKAKEKLTVILTGDGADEIFNGYFHQKLMILRQRWRWSLENQFSPGLLKALMKIIPPRLINKAFDYPDAFGEREYLKLLQSIDSVQQFGSFYESVVSCFNAADKERLYQHDFATTISAPPLANEFQETMQSFKGFSFFSQLTLLDLKYWIPFSTLFRLDKMNMAHAVETRCPYLDHRVVEMTLGLHNTAKLNSQRNKEILRWMNEQLFPPGLREKGKQAFYMPMTTCYTNRFFSWARRLLTPQTVSKRGWFHWNYIETLFLLAENGSMLGFRQLASLALLEQWVTVFESDQ